MLLLCTANQCRSPMAEVLLRHHLAEAGVDATVSSAGLYEGGAPATDHGRAAMADRGLDLEGHRSRRVDPDMVLEADLVIGMAREHVREAAVIDPAVLSKAFTLKELVRGARLVGPRRPDEAFSGWLDRVGATRRREDLLGSGYDDALDVEDPAGRGRDDYEVTAELIDGLLRTLVRLAWPSSVREASA